LIATTSASIARDRQPITTNLNRVFLKMFSTFILRVSFVSNDFLAIYYCGA
jgi:hypothetical protein